MGITYYIRFKAIEHQLFVCHCRSVCIIQILTADAAYFCDDFQLKQVRAAAAESSSMNLYQ